jgi:hypothetical protein
MVVESERSSHCSLFARYFRLEISEVLSFNKF